MNRSQNMKYYKENYQVNSNRRSVRYLKTSKSEVKVPSESSRLKLNLRQQKQQRKERLSEYEKLKPYMTTLKNISLDLMSSLSNGESSG